MHENSLPRMLLVVLLLSSLIPSQGQIPVRLEEDINRYYGFEYGAAGILIALLDYLQLNEDQSVRIAIEKGYEALWNARYETDGKKYPIWQKIEDGDIYPGIKYGSAGIAKSFLKAYDVIGEKNYLLHAEEILDFLYQQAEDPKIPSWAYAYANISLGSLGIKITDHRYGSLGIIASFIDLYKSNQNPRYLDMAVNATSWLIKIANNYTIGEQTMGILSWYEGEEIIELTSREQGNAALIPILDQLFEVTNNEYYNNWSRFILDWYNINQNVDGSWFFNINLGENSLTSFDLGVSGILYSMLESDLLVSEDFLMIQKGYDWLANQFISNDTHFIIPEYPDNKFGWTAINRGLTGVIKAISALPDDLLSPKYQEIISNSIGWLIFNATSSFDFNGTNYLGIIPRSNYDGYIDLSYTEGIAGIMAELINLRINNIIPDAFSGQSQLIIDSIKDILLDFQDEGFLWPKQVSISTKGNTDLIYIGIIIFLIPVVLYLVYKSRRVR